MVNMARIMTGPYNLNTYILSCPQTGDAVIIDPGGPASDWLDYFNENRLNPVKILHTHGHADQFFSTWEFKKIFNIPSCLYHVDDDFFKDPEVQQQTYQAVGLPAPFPADIRLNDNDEITFGQSMLRVIHTPGHTPGSACFMCEDHLYTGDAIFVGEAGRTDLPGGNLDGLIESIKTRILTLNKKTVIHPGHHHTGTAIESTIEQEMKDNIYITDFILDP